MSDAFYLICHETKEMICVGQGRTSVRGIFYSGDKSLMLMLKKFLNDHRGRKLYFEDEHRAYECGGYKDVEMPEGLDLQPKTEEVLVVPTVDLTELAYWAARRQERV